MRLPRWLPVVVFCVAAFSNAAFAQNPQRFGVGAKVSTLGIGVEGAVQVTDRSIVRGSFNFFDYDRIFHEQGITYDGLVKLRSVQITYDQYLAGLFHVSPGILFLNGNRIEATADVPAGQPFTLGNVPFFSNPADPVQGTGRLDTNSVAPVVLVGLGNLLPRRGGHFGWNVDAGVVFQGSPDVRLNLAGSACVLSPTTLCGNVATDPIVRAAVQSEEQRLADEAKPYKYYPIVSVSFMFKF